MSDYVERFNVLPHWYHSQSRTTWEKQLTNLGARDEQGRCHYAWTETPAWTRIDIQRPMVVSIPKGQTKHSLSRREVESQNTASALLTTSSAKKLLIIHCATPWSDQSIGYAYLPLMPTSRHAPHISVIHEKSLAVQSTGYNCMIVVDVLHDWLLMVYTTCHVRKGVAWRIRPFPVSSNTHVIDNSYYLKTWLQPNSYISNLESFLLQQKDLTNKQEVLSSLKWNEFLLGFAIEMLVRGSVFTFPFAIDNLCALFSSWYCRGQEVKTFIDCCLVTEGLHNVKYNRQWYTHFVIKALMTST